MGEITNEEVKIPYKRTRTKLSFAIESFEKENRNWSRRVLKM